MEYEIPNVVMEVSQQEENNHYENVNEKNVEVKRKVCASVYLRVHQCPYLNRHRLIGLSQIMVIYLTSASILSRNLRC